jgi:ketosteroid isomerase-like protein
MNAPANDHWVLKMYRDADSLNADRAMSWLTPDVVQRMGNAPETHGAAQARTGYEHMLGAVKSMSHQFLNIWDVDPTTTVAEALCTYVRKDGRTLTLPATTILRRRGDKVCDIRVYIDPGPLLQA